MNGEPGNLSRSVAWATVLAVALFHVLPTRVQAEDPPADAPAAEATTDDPSAQETVEGLVGAPGGVPAEPMDASSAIDTVKAAMATIQKDEAGIGNAYTIQFGDTFDWVQMSSGEWVKGNIERMRDDTMEFDSDDLDMLYLDFADVVIVHSPQVNTYVFDDRISATGKAVITEELVIVQTADEGTKTFPRSELESIVEGEREKDWWSMKLRFGLTLNKGNTDQLTYDIKFSTRREDRLTLLDLSYESSFGQTDGTQNVNRHLGEAAFQVFLGSRWWVTPAFGQLFNDRFQNIQFRATPAAGAGVHIIDVPNVAWDFQTGVGYQYLRYTSDADPTLENPQSDAFIPLYTYWDFDITGDIDLTLSWLTNLVVTTIGNTNHTGKADLAIELTSILDLDIAFLFLRTEQPAQPAPTTPPDPPATPIEKNDYQLVVGISLELG